MGKRHLLSKHSFLTLKKNGHRDIKEAGGKLRNQMIKEKRKEKEMQGPEGQGLSKGCSVSIKCSSFQTQDSKIGGMKVENNM